MLHASKYSNLVLLDFEKIVNPITKLHIGFYWKAVEILEIQSSAEYDYLTFEIRIQNKKIIFV